MHSLYGPFCRPSQIRGKRNQFLSGYQFDVVVRDDGYLAAHEGQDAGLADDVLIALVVRVDGHAGVAEHGLGTGRGDDEVAGAVGERIAYTKSRSLFIKMEDNVLHLIYNNLPD